MPRLQQPPRKVLPSVTEYAEEAEEVPPTFAAPSKVRFGGHVASRSAPKYAVAEEVKDAKRYGSSDASTTLRSSPGRGGPPGPPGSLGSKKWGTVKLAMMGGGMKPKMLQEMHSNTTLRELTFYVHLKGGDQLHLSNPTYVACKYGDRELDRSEARTDGPTPLWNHAFHIHLNTGARPSVDDGRTRERNAFQGEERATRSRDPQASACRT